MKSYFESFLVFCGACFVVWCVFTAGVTIKTGEYSVRFGGLTDEQIDNWNIQRTFLYKTNFGVGSPQHWLIMLPVQNIERNGYTDFPTRWETYMAFNYWSPYSYPKNIRLLRFTCMGEKYSVVNEPIYWMDFNYRPIPL